MRMSVIMLSVALLAQGGTDWVSFTLLEGFPVTFSNNLCGISMAGPSKIMACDPVCDSLFFINIDGTLDTTTPITAGCANAYGVCTAQYQGQGYYFFNDSSSTSDTYLWKFLGDWSFIPNPAGGLGRGMDYDFGDEYIWQASIESGSSLIRCKTDGSSVWTYLIPEVLGEISGVAAFPFEGETGLLITGKTDDQFHIYKSTLGVLQYIGSGQIPDPAAEISLDVAVSGSTFWWSYRKQGVQYLAKFEAEITQHLEAQTWAGIKGSFHY